MLIPCSSSLIILTRFLIDVTAGALGYKFSAYPPLVVCGIAAITADRAPATGVSTAGAVMIVIGC